MRKFQFKNEELEVITDPKNEVTVAHFEEIQPVLMDIILPFINTINAIQEKAGTQNPSDYLKYVSLKGISDFEKSGIMRKICNILLQKSINDEYTATLTIHEFNLLVSKLKKEIETFFDFFMGQIGSNTTKFIESIKGMKQKTQPKSQ